MDEISYTLLAQLELALVEVSRLADTNKLVTIREVAQLASLLPAHSGDSS